MIFQLIFTCATAEKVSHAELDEFANKTAEIKSKFGITGILLCRDGSIMQVIEGERTTVEAFFAYIETDPRLTNLIVLMRRHLPVREFSTWTMGYPNAKDSDVTFDLGSQTLPNLLPDHLSPEIRVISQTFARVNGLAYA